jgi:ribonuclease HII
MEQYFEKDKLELGIDEAGRGCLFGPVSIAGVVWINEEIDSFIEIRDSKKLSLKKRLLAYDYILDNSIANTSILIHNEGIDKDNILKTTLKGMHKCVDNITDQLDIDIILVDGNQFNFYMDKNGECINHKCVINGDNKYKSIAAASILAKVNRDNYINDLCEEYPELKKYDIHNNKGYGTKKHLDAIKEYGITKWHRKTFGICKEYC